MHVGCIKSYTKDLSYRSFISKWLVHNQFVGLDNSLKVVVYYLLIGRMIGLSHRDEFPIVIVLVCMVIVFPLCSFTYLLFIQSKLVNIFFKLFCCSCNWDNMMANQVLASLSNSLYLVKHLIMLSSLWVVINIDI